MKPFSWPELTKPEPLDDGRSWTATFDSYDQYREVCYYRVVIVEPRTEIMVAIGTEMFGDDWRHPIVIGELRMTISGVAATGVTNTTYAGRPLR